MQLRLPDTTTVAPLTWGLTLSRTLMLLLAIAAIEGGTILIADPWQQLAGTRNAGRVSAVNVIANGFYMDFAEHRGTSSCTSGPVPTNPAWLESSGGGYDLAPCLVPVYLTIFPHDPRDPAAYYRGTTDYRSGYRIMRNTRTGRLLVEAPSAELGQTIQVER